MLHGIAINNYLGQDNIMDTEKNLYRKYFDWRNLKFWREKRKNKCTPKKREVENKLFMPCTLTVGYHCLVVR